LPDADEQASREALNAGFRASLWRYFARRVRDGSEIEDMVQEVFARLLKRGNVGGVTHLGGYVFETASSVLTDRLRKRRSHHADAHEEYDDRTHGDVDFSPEHVLIGKERLARATAVLLELPERTRVIFVLRRLEGMKYLDIAARLGLSVSAIEKHMQRAVAHLASRLEDER
jgi:RNA polymerase sigma factor (sigma-70 family)